MPVKTEKEAVPTKRASPPRKHTITCKPLGDKVELSPNSWAKCQVCKSKILEGEPRIGKEVYYAPRNYFQYRYYHQACFEKSPETLRLASGKSPSEELARKVQEKAQKHETIRQRDDLREALRALRSLFARRLDTAHFCIFHDTVLDQLVLSLPRNKEELMHVYGIKEQKYESFGEPIL